MSKKRVHEIAKELKSFGIDLDNKEVVTELDAERAALGTAAPVPAEEAKAP